MKPYIREKKSFDFSEVPENTSFEAGYLVTVNSGWRSIRPVINQDKCVGCEQCYLYCPDGVISIRNKKKLKLIMISAKAAEYVPKYAEWVQ